jgi:hypothetical protein
MCCAERGAPAGCYPAANQSRPTVSALSPPYGQRVRHFRKAEATPRVSIDMTLAQKPLCFLPGCEKADYCLG